MGIVLRIQDPKDRAAELAAQQAKADQKVDAQARLVRRVNGAAVLHPEEQLLLNEMEQNRAALSLNRAMFDYGNEPS
jgi:hypothetical protein